MITKEEKQKIISLNYVHEIASRDAKAQQEHLSQLRQIELYQEQAFILKIIVISLKQKSQLNYRSSIEALAEKRLKEIDLERMIQRQNKEQFSIAKTFTKCGQAIGSSLTSKFKVLGSLLSTLKMSHTDENPQHYKIEKSEQATQLKGAQIGTKQD